MEETHTLILIPKRELRCINKAESIYADVVVIGSGAGGATVFERLAKRGIDVLLIEEGSAVTQNVLDDSIPERIRMLYRNAGLSPILGIPPIAYGEGRVLGGSTEINGGLLWKTPPPVLADWIERGLFRGYSALDINQEFERIQRDLNVITTETLGGYDSDSALLSEGARKLGWSSVLAERAVIGCQRLNQCGAGCPSGAKQSMSQTYIPRAVANGGRILTETKVVRLRSCLPGAVESVECILGNGPKKIHVYARDFFLSAGALHSPALVSTLSRGIHKFPLGLHLNTKVIAEFPQEVNAHSGTIFTDQVQTFIDEGILMMATNFGPEFLALGLSSADQNTTQYLTERMKHLGLYTVQTRPQSYGKLVGVSGKLLSTFQVKRADAAQLVDGVIKICGALFEAGATSIWLPIKGLPCVHSPQEAISRLTSTNAADWQLSTVHAMSSLPLGHKNKFSFDVGGRNREWRNLYVADASALPTTVGESPQGSIMLIASSIAESYMESRA